MLDDIINAAQVPIYIVGTGIFLFATYRALSIGRVLVKGAYRNRAFWTGGTMIALILFSTATTLPSSNPLVGVSFFLIFATLFAFADSSVMVAQETDFFHRSPLGWQRLRKPLYVILVGSALVCGLLALFESTNGPLFLTALNIAFFAGVLVVVPYAAAALLVGARRTPDRSMRRFVRMLGLAVGCLGLFFTVWIPFSPFSVTVQDLGNLISELFIPAAAYFLYLAVMSLSPIGRVQKEIEAPGRGETLASSGPSPR